MPRPTLTIDLDAIASNWRALDALSDPAETAAAVKADAYGCGLVPVAGALWHAGCRTFFVASLSEAIALRTALPDAGINILNGVAGAEAQEARQHTLRPCLNSPQQVMDWAAAGGGPCTLQIDSGMGRLGVQPSDIASIADSESLRAALREADLVMSHLACADEREATSNDSQREQFDSHVATLRAVLPSFRCSLAATGGTLLGPDYHRDLVRCGIGLYGGHPFTDARPAVTLSTPPIQIRDVPAGANIGYGGTWRAPRPSRIATLPLGYADGFHRALSNCSVVYIDGKPAPLAGRVSMDLLTVDVTDHPAFGTQDTVEIIGPNQPVDTLATAAGTIGYEILTSLGTRFDRRYKSAN